VVRYIADAMIAFGVAYPKDKVLLLEPPTIDLATTKGVRMVTPPPPVA
jgi:hypothetical protein